jgi:hypothetical protein
MEETSSGQASDLSSNRYNKSFFSELPTTKEVHIENERYVH